MIRVTKPRILVVEDEPGQMELLSYNLSKEGYEVLTARDGEEALVVTREEMPDLILLDWMIPHITGIELCRQFKRDVSTRHIPVILLTARGEEEDKIRGLDTGAEDYIVKPYSIHELLARVRVVLRRRLDLSSSETVAAAGIEVDTAAHVVRCHGALVKLGPIEYKLLLIFFESIGRVLSREQLLDHVWGRHSEIETRTVDVHVGRLRKALSKAGGDNLICTVRGFGYRLEETV